MIQLTENFRWYGKEDTVSLDWIVQMGCSGVISSLHHIPYGDIWSFDEIIKYKENIESHDLKWAAVESLPVSEEIKSRSGDYISHIENYKESIKNLGKAGIDIVIYNFMPVLDWVRTDLNHLLEDGTKTLLFDPIKFAAFELFILKRDGAEHDYLPNQINKAKEFFDSLNPKQLKAFESHIIDVFPGVKLGLSIEDLRKMLANYDGIDSKKLKENLSLFLNEVVPVCEEAGVRLAIHPDDPPFSILGLPRIVSTEGDFKDLIGMIDSPANGICFCTGSLSPREDNNLVRMIEQLGDRINCFHLRSTQRNSDGTFYEANHLEGSVDMYRVVKAALNLMKERKEHGRADWQLPFRPDHGHTMMDDLLKPTPANPGYSAIGRLRGLAEIRGLQQAIGREIS